MGNDRGEQKLAANKGYRWIAGTEQGFSNNVDSCKD